MDEKEDREAQEFEIKAVAATVFVGEGHQTSPGTSSNVLLVASQLDSKRYTLFLFM